MTQRTVFSMCGKLVGQFPVCGWLRVIAEVLKRRVTVVIKEWDASLRQVMEETLASMTCDDLVQGNWGVSGEKLNVWVDASSLATGGVLERHEGCMMALSDQRPPAYKFSRA